MNEQKEFSCLGFSMTDKAFTHLYMRLPDIGFIERGVYGYIVDFAQNQDRGNGLKDYAYPTKVRMAAEGKIARGTLDEVIERLIKYDMIDVKKIPNKRGGRPISAYKPLPLLNPKEFLARYGDLLSEEDRRDIRRMIEEGGNERVHVADPGRAKEESASTGDIPLL